MLASFEHHVGRCWLDFKLAHNFVPHHATLLGQQCCMMLASFEQAFRLQQRDASTKESKDTVLESDDFPLRRLFDNNL